MVRRLLHRVLVSMDVVAWLLLGMMVWFSLISLFIWLMHRRANALEKAEVKRGNWYRDGEYE